MNIKLYKATADDAENLVSIQKKAFKRLYDIYKDENSSHLKGTEEFHRWLNHPYVLVLEIIDRQAAKCYYFSHSLTGKSP